MKPMIMILCAALATATGASAAEPFAAPEREKALMLYFAKSFGSTQRQNRTPLQFGLKLQQSSPLVSNRTFALFDARYSLGGETTLAFAGLSFDGSVGSSSGSSEVARAHPGWTAAAIILAIAAGACILETGLCEGDDGYNEPAAPESPGVGAGNGT